MNASDLGLSTVVKRVRIASTLLALSGSLFASACTPRAVPRPDAQNEEEVAAHEVERLPKEGVTPILVDFAGKVHLVGYQVEPADAVRPGGSVKLSLYWRKIGSIEPGFRVATYVMTGARIDAFESGGPLRDEKLGPSAWRTSKLYADTQTFVIPSDLEAKELTLAVGITRDAVPRSEVERAEDPSKKPGETPAETAPPSIHPPLRLSILSGASDGHERAILSHLKNDVAAKTAPRARRAPGELGRRTPPRAASSAR